MMDISLASFSQLPCWVSWDLTPDGKKPPRTPDRRRLAKINDPRDWGTCDEAWGNRGIGPTNGVGIVLGAAELAGGRLLGGIDLDSCRDKKTGEQAPWAAEIIRALPAYWEVSPSGTGLHGFFLYRIADRETLRAALKTHGHSWKKPGQVHPHGIEVYIESRYFTVNLKSLRDGRIPDLPAADLLRLIQEIGPGFAPKQQTKKPPDATRSGWAYRLAVKTVAFGKGKRAFLEALYDDPDGAAWAEENRPYNEDRAWESASKYAWMGEWKRHKNGAPLCNLDNTLQSLRHAEELAGLLGYDEMRCAEILLKPIPGGDEVWAGPRPVRDVDVTAIQEWLQENWLVTVSRETVFQAAALCAWERPFHPVRDYLTRLEWDGVDRLDNWLAVYLGAERNAYTAAIGRMFLIAMVARIFRPGVQADYMLVLEGSQGLRKSTACRVLAGDDYFSDAMPDLRDDRIASEHLAGKWLIEISELSAFSRSESAALKAFLTRRDEKYIKRYGRKEVVEKRQCVFIGTTNESHYLRDPTGGRRFWPVVTGEIDIEALRRDRDQLFAEAVVRFQRGEKSWPDRDFEAAHIMLQQDARFEQDPWEDLIAAYLADKVKTTVQDVASALGVFTDRLHPGVSKRIVAILKRLGYVQKRTMTERAWVFDL